MKTARSELRTATLEWRATRSYSGAERRTVAVRATINLSAIPFVVLAVALAIVIVRAAGVL